MNRVIAKNQILIERQSQLENRLAEFLPSSSLSHRSTFIEQWFDRINRFVQKLTFNNTIMNNNSKSINKSLPVRFYE